MTEKHDCSHQNPDADIEYWKAAVVVVVVIAYQTNTIFSCVPLNKKVFPLVCAALLVAMQVESPRESYCAIHKNFSTLLTLVGTMIFAAILEKNRVMPVLRNLITAGPCWMKSRHIFFLRVSFATVVVSALFTNDCACVLMVPLVLEGLKELGFEDTASIKVTLVAVSTSSNIGACLFPTGSPQTLIIFSTDKLTLSDFVHYMAGPVAAAFVLNYTGLITYYYCYKKREVTDSDSQPTEKSQLNSKPVNTLLDTMILSEQQNSKRRRFTFSTERFSSLMPPDAACWNREQTGAVPDTGTPIYGTLAGEEEMDTYDTEMQMNDVEELTPDASVTDTTREGVRGAGQEDSQTRNKNVKIVLLLILFVLYPIYVIIGSWCEDLPGIGEIGWTSMLLASLGLLVHWKDANHILEQKVEWSIIVFFLGTFVVMSTLVDRGLAQIPVQVFYTPRSHWTFLSRTTTTINTTQPVNLTNLASSTTANGTADVWHSWRNTMQVTASTLLLSNVIGNVPLVVLVLGVLKWNKMLLLLLTFVSAVGGNLTFIGAATHIIVSENKNVKHLTCKDITTYGILTTFPITAVGAAMIWSMMACNDPFADYCSIDVKLLDDY